ncbi:MAG: monovalent cation:proton antiporter-2 (CPA2) family protein [Pseudomonadota bacterium]|nr:monovalent cation:proton antiporter-2 (CPA2) family protein [Pseudomonadota bacterium]
MDSLFVQAFVYLAAALVVVPIAKRLGLGSVLGYLLAGLLIGPWGLHLVGAEGGQDVMHFAEFGVVMMLFLVGLELDPATLWRLRGPILGLGGLQVLGTATVVAGIALALGLPWQQAVALGLILAMSSTAIALQSLAEKGLMKSDAGQKSFAVLLFQDIAVIPMLAVFPLLATVTVAGGGEGEGHGASFVDHLPAWQHGAVVLGAISAVVGAGRFLVRPAMRAVAQTGLREMFTAAALLLVIGVTLLMSLVGLSPALGTFLAGVVLANSEYRHELESDIEPFKGLLLGLFFIAVGASIDFGLLLDGPVKIVGLLVGVIGVKIGLLLALGRAFGARRDQGAILAVALCQVGEFAFVLFSFAGQSGVLPDDIIRPMVAVTALSMAASPLLLAVNERFVLPRLVTVKAETRESDVEDEHNPVIVAGYGRFGQIAGRFLRANGIGVTGVDVDSELMDVLGKFGQKVFYGDASRLDLLRAAGAGTAKVLIVAVDQHAKAMEIVHTARKHFPHLTILARARGRTEAYELIDAGVEEVYRETFDTSLRVGADALRALGVHAYVALRGARTFRRYDEQSVRELAALRNDQAKLVSTARERVSALSTALQADLRGAHGFGDHAWDSETIREGLGLVPPSEASAAPEPAHEPDATTEA